MRSGAVHTQAAQLEMGSGTGHEQAGAGAENGGALARQRGGQSEREGWSGPQELGEGCARDAGTAAEFQIGEAPESLARG